jgi:hypothetical protein
VVSILVPTITDISHTLSLNVVGSYPCTNLYSAYTESAVVEKFLTKETKYNTKMMTMVLAGPKNISKIGSIMVDAIKKTVICFGKSIFIPRVNLYIM